MWKCPKCDTRNEHAFCAVCGEPRPVIDESEKMIRKNDRFVKILLAVIAVLVVIMIVLLCIVPIINSIPASRDSGREDYPSYKLTAEPEKKEKIPEKTNKPKEEGLQIVEVSARKHTNKVDEIIIETTEFVEPVMSTLSDPARVILDFEGCTLKNKAVSTGISGYNFKDIRKGEHETYSRIVIDIKVSCSVSTEVIDNKCYVTLTPKD